MSSNYFDSRNSTSSHDNKLMIRSRKLSHWQVPDDIQFCKRIAEKFDPSLNENEILNPSSKVDYYRQPSKEPTRDPREYSSLPKTRRDFAAPLLIADSNWIRGEPARHILITQITSKQVRTSLNLYALLEDSFRINGDEIVNVNLLSINSEKLCASILFTSGYKAWDFVISSKEDNPFNWVVSSDSSGLEFERIKNELKERELEQEMSKARSDRQKSSSFASSPYKPYSSSVNHSNTAAKHATQKSNCNPFVPCLKIPFSCESNLPFRLNEEVLMSLFPIVRFPSISGVEEGGSSWHIHFGREIDVVEADKMFQNDVFVWKGHRFYFEKWRLTKGDASWTIPDHYTRKMDKKKESIGMKAEDITMVASDLNTAYVTNWNDVPRILKKRPLIEHLTDTNENNFEDSTTIKMKVKRKPVKKRPFVSPSSTPLIEERHVGDSSEEMIDIEDGEEEHLNCPVLRGGSARTEGYFKLKEKLKSLVRFRGILEAFSSSASVSSLNTSNASSTAATDSSANGRSSRAQNRRPLLHQSVNTTTLDLFKVSPLQSTQKLVSLRNSSIHSFGLVLLEPAEPGDLIIEYVGELVRASVANIREWKYEREYRGDGIASSYLFRLDDIMVIDASQKGSLARFINHSCDPNCVAKTIILNGSKRIVMYAKKSVRSGEEITYDYKFPTEKDPNKKVKCLCGASNCRRSLN